MYLKQVHMENFKSFGRKLTVPFAKGFTAITGPNGSGKSNIGDAILFVLGPRSSKAIRAGKLSELIFNGGKDGQPAKECTVSLTFTNMDRLMPIDADEVTLTRRVRRAPKPDDPDAYYSYFYVNGKAAGLKDFADLLDHARISADGYNIVTQGSVLNLVEMGPVNRRRIIESIAGITEFDKDIDKAKGQQEEVANNLERIGIVLTEIDRNLRQLKKDRDGALRYKELAGTLSIKRGQRALATKTDIEARIARTQERIEKLQGEREKAVEKVNELRAKERDLTKELAQIETDIADTGGEELKEIHAKVQTLRDQRSKAEANANHARDEVEEIGHELTDLRSDMKQLEHERDKIQTEAETHEEHAVAVRAKADELQNELDEYNETLAQTDTDAMDIQRKLAELKKNFEHASARKHEDQLGLDRLNDRREVTAEQLTELDERVRRLQTDIDELDILLEDVKDQSDPNAAKQFEKLLFEKKKRQAQLTEEIRDLERAADRARTRLAELRAQKAAAEGAAKNYTHAVDAILAARDKGHIKGVCGTIAELGQVDKRFSTAIETAAGARLQCIVVETARDAQAGIEYLRDQRLGRATFLPLDKMAKSMPRGKSLMAVKDAASHGFAAELIDYNPRYDNAFRYVFGDTVVVDNLADARRLMGGVRLVTQQGDLIEAGGAMTGGSNKGGKRSVAFGGVDASEIEKASQELRAAETHVDTLSNEMGDLRGEILELEDNLRATRGSTDTLVEKAQSLEKTRADIANKFEKAKEARHAKAGEVDKLEAEIEAADELLAKANDQLADMEADRDRLGKALLSTTKKEFADRIRKVQKDLDDSREAAREAEKKRDVARERVQLAQERVDGIAKRIASLETERDGHTNDLVTLEKEMAGLQTEIDALEESSREANDAVRELHDKRDTVKDKLGDLKVAINKKTDEAEVGYGLIRKEKDNLPALEEQLGEAMVELREANYQHPDDEPLPPLDELRRDIRNIEANINALGPINQRALEDYEEQDARKNELAEEVTHLNEEHDALVKLVEEITTRKTEDFMKVFDAINENFKRVYARMSVGGSAYLKLENEKEPFEGGMTIMARPKGKRVIRLEAISGGEKGMTALAFIFAVQEYEPSPFYYLDEVDQNLDGVNSDVVGRMVASNSKKAQFIVVSLRKVTLRQADHIYGVTMQKVGLSEIVGNFDISQLRDADGNGPKEGPLDRMDQTNPKPANGSAKTKGANGSTNGTKEVPMESTAATTKGKATGGDSDDDDELVIEEVA